MYPNDELTPFCPGEKKALEAGDVDDEQDTCNRCGENLDPGDIDICGICYDEFLDKMAKDD